MKGKKKLFILFYPHELITTAFASLRKKAVQENFKLMEKFEKAVKKNNNNNQDRIS